MNSRHINVQVKIESYCLSTTQMLCRLDLVRARTAGLELAVLALKDVPMGTRVTHGTNPLDQGGLRLEKVERVVAVCMESHCDVGLSAR